MSARNIAIIGAGPASLYGAAKLAKAGHNVVILNRDVKPGGLAEYGIYLNKYKMKGGLRKIFGRTLAQSNVHYFGNVTVGVGEAAAMTVDEVRALGFDAVVVAVGAQGTKWLGLPGEDAEGVFHAKDLVYHYNHLPPFSEQEFAIGQDVAVVGFGNVSLDIVHWLVCEKKVESVTIVARRGPAERASTPKELKLVSGAMDVDQIRAEITDRIAASLQSLGQDPEAELADITKFVDVPLETDSPTKVRMTFLHSPKGIASEEGRATGLICEKTLLKPPREEGGRPGLDYTGEESVVPCDTVVFAIGDSIDPQIGLPLEPRWRSTFATVPEPWAAHPDRPRYMVHDPEANTPLWGTFVVGWARRASDGLVGKARKDAETGCEEIQAWLDGELGEGPGEAHDADAVLGALRDALVSREVAFVDRDGLAAIEAEEKARATAGSLPEFKFDHNAEMLAIALAAQS